MYENSSVVDSHHDECHLRSIRAVMKRSAWLLKAAVGL